MFGLTYLSLSPEISTSETVWELVRLLKETIKFKTTFCHNSLKSSYATF